MSHFKQWTNLPAGTRAAIATLVVLAGAQGALAQGYGSAPAGGFNWSGWYLGGNVGWGNREANPYPSTSYYEGLGVSFGAGGLYGGTTGGSTAPIEQSKHRGFTAGATLGYQYQFNWLVLGVDYDLQYADLGDKPKFAQTSFTLPRAGFLALPGAGYTAGNYDPTDGDDNKWLGIARLRAGIALNRWMLYATGGAAYRFNYASYDPYVVSPDGTVKTLSGVNSAGAWGWALGGGVEYALNSWVTTKAEYLHLGFSKSTYIDPIATTAVGSPVISKYDRDIDMVRLGLSFKFNFGGGSGY